MTATIGRGSTALWYLTRSTGLVALVLLSATLVLGIVSSMGWAGERWPRFFSQAVHRNLSLLCLVFVAVHVVTTVADGYVPIGLLDAVVPFRSAYRPIWVGFGSLAFDFLLAVVVTSALRRRLGPRMWRGVHWLAYVCWPIAVLHGLGTGSDPRFPVTQAVGVACVVAVVGATAWRLVDGRGLSHRWRVGGAVGGAVILLGTAIFAVLGPLRPGWSHRAGTS
ncbi:MAG TPA: ferric reductase-like transmembrane domain-containing protein, partial [Acidimicrobiales bacterium]